MFNKNLKTILKTFNTAINDLEAYVKATNFSIQDVLKEMSKLEEKEGTLKADSEKAERILAKLKDLVEE